MRVPLAGSFRPLLAGLISTHDRYLTRDEMEAVLTAPDQSTWIGRRDYALLLTMYNSEARLSEMTGMQRGQVKFDSTTYLQLHGKGRKERVVPLWAKTGRVLRKLVSRM
jgi:integrase/recombinase XerD